MNGLDFKKRTAVQGSEQIEFEVTLDGKPFGLIWTQQPEPGLRFAWWAKVIGEEDAARCKDYQHAVGYFVAAAA